VLLVIAGILFSTAAAVGAQSGYTAGLYEFETEYPEMDLTGAGWFVESGGGVSYLYTTTVDDSIEFDVVGDYLVVYRVVNTSGTYKDIEICVDATCVTMPSLSVYVNDSSYPFGIAIPDGSATITITNVNGYVTYLDSFMVLAQGIP